MIIAVVGPTGIGKTALSIALAKHYQAEIINFDSMQVYEKLDIGTAKVTKEEMQGIKHHLLSYVPITSMYSVFDYQKDARGVLDQLLREKKNVILVGGTGLYLKALLYDYQFQEGTTYNSYDELSTEELVEHIKQYNYQGTFDPHNRKRLVRLLNKLENKEEIASNGNVALYDFKIVGLTMERKVLYDRLNDRVDKMFADGLLAEVESVKDLFPVSKALQTGIGYKEFMPYFEKKQTLDEVKETIKRNSRRYAKRQFTFFKHQFPVRWYEVDCQNFASTIASVITDLG